MSKVYAVSFPKSGRTWLELMIAKLQSIISGRHILDYLNGRPRIIFGHGINNHELCRGIMPKCYRGKSVLLLVRDPRDIVVSHYYYIKYNKKNFNDSLSDFIRWPVDDTRWGIEAAINYVNTWLESRHKLKSFHVVKYENLHKNIYLELINICNFLNLKADKSQIRKAVEYASFSNMRIIEIMGELPWHGLNHKNGESRELKTRQGKIGGWREELNEEDKVYINEHMKRLHYFYGYHI